MVKYIYRSLEHNTGLVRKIAWSKIRMITLCRGSLRVHPESSQRILEFKAKFNISAVVEMS